MNIVVAFFLGALAAIFVIIVGFLIHDSAEKKKDEKNRREREFRDLFCRVIDVEFAVAALKSKGGLK